MKSDEQLKVNVLSELAWDPCVARLDVAVGNGVVIVTAPLESYPNRHAIERAVQRVAGDVKVQHRWVAGASRSLSARLGHAVGEMTPFAWTDLRWRKARRESAP